MGKLKVVNIRFLYIFTYEKVCKDSNKVVDLYTTIISFRILLNCRLQQVKKKGT